MEETMNTNSRPIQAVTAGSLGIFWFIGWLFTLGFTQPSWWQALLGLIVWPYYLGLAVR
jgi:hypothetical protein